MNANGPIALETDTQLTALGFRADPELGELDTPNGHFTFLQAVGLTEDEMGAMMCWDGEKFLAELEKQIPLCITDLLRTSMIESPAFRTVCQKGVEQDGSSTSFLYMDELGFQHENGHAVLRLGAGHGETLARMLRARVGKGRSLFLQGSRRAVLFHPGEQTGVSEEDGVPVLTLQGNTLEELCTVLQFHTGVYPLTSFSFIVELVATKITDQSGNVIQVIE